MSASAVAQLFTRLQRHCLATEEENAGLRKDRRLAEARITELRDENERLRRELAAKQAEHGELVDQVIDWLGQGEEIVRTGVARVGKPVSNGRPVPQADFDRSFGTSDTPS
jgi:hypothetical protein